MYLGYVGAKNGAAVIHSPSGKLLKEIKRNLGYNRDRSLMEGSLSTPKFVIINF
jgi:hypothetical protein